MPKKKVRSVGKSKNVVKKVNMWWVVGVVLLVVMGVVWVGRGAFLAKPLSINETTSQQLVPVDTIEYYWTFINSSALGPSGWQVRNDPDRATLPPILQDGNLYLRGSLNNDTYIYTNDILDKQTTSWGWILSDVIAGGYTMSIEVDVEGLSSQAGPITQHVMRMGVSKGDSWNLVPETMVPVVTKEVSKVWSTDGSKNTFRFEFSADEMATIIRLRCIKLTLSPYASGLFGMKIGEVRIMKTKWEPVPTSTQVPSPTPSGVASASPSTSPTATPLTGRVTKTGRVIKGTSIGSSGYYLAVGSGSNTKTYRLIPKAVPKPVTSISQIALVKPATDTLGPYLGKNVSVVGNLTTSATNPTNTPTYAGALQVISIKAI